MRHAGPPSAGRNAASGPYIGRLAPSPTGKLHVGHARSFLIAWWRARQLGGEIRMRLEDLDEGRCRPEYFDGCLQDLEWLGIDWDGEPELQSANLPRIREAARQLEASGLTFACTCSRRDIREAVSAPHHAPTAYPGTCRDRHAAWSQLAADARPALRFRVEADKTVQWRDELLGKQETAVGREAGDFVIMRRNGEPAYQLAVVVDDAAGGITEVLRGDDLVDSTAQQLLLYSALGLPAPKWVHVPLVLDDADVRLAKRHDALSLAALRSAGIDARAIVAWVARSAAMPVDGLATPEELIDVFEISRIPRAPVRSPASSADAWPTSA